MDIVLCIWLSAAGESNDRGIGQTANKGTAFAQQYYFSQITHIIVFHIAGLSDCVHNQFVAPVIPLIIFYGNDKISINCHYLIFELAVFRDKEKFFEAIVLREKFIDSPFYFCKTWLNWMSERLQSDIISASQIYSKAFIRAYAAAFPVQPFFHLVCQLYILIKQRPLFLIVIDAHVVAPAGEDVFAIPAEENHILALINLSSRQPMFKPEVAVEHGRLFCSSSTLMNGI